jgi:ABC-2 type transport system permease protein
MGKTLFANIQKELLLLRRDLVGLLVIFLMPVVLVVVVTLVQQNVMKTLGKTKIKALILDRDGSGLDEKIKAAFTKSGDIDIAENPKAVSVEELRRIVAKGDFQFAIVIPEGTLEGIRHNARASAREALSTGNANGIHQSEERVKAPDIQVYFDPALREDVRSGITSSLENIIRSMDVNEKIQAISAILPEEIANGLKKALGFMWSEEFRKSLPEIRMKWDDTPAVQIREETAQFGDSVKTPNTVQQNVPAWTLFGMFFIVVPLAGSLLKERQQEMLVRLLTMPQSCLTILAGKAIAFILICIIQFVVIMLIGKFLLPLLGTPVLDLGSSPVALVAITLSAALAACGYGIFLGTMARTYEQASTFGAVSVVIAAAIGGIMVPVYVMPQFMQKLSVISPLSWGLNAFLDVFVRGGDLFSVLPDIALLLIFFLVTCLLAWFNLSRRGHVRVK